MFFICHARTARCVRNPSHRRVLSQLSLFVPPLSADRPSRATCFSRGERPSHPRPTPSQLPSFTFVFVTTPRPFLPFFRTCSWLARNTLGSTLGMARRISSACVRTVRFHPHRSASSYPRDLPTSPLLLLPSVHHAPLLASFDSSALAPCAWLVRPSPSLDRKRPFVHTSLMQLLRFFPSTRRCHGT